MTVDPGWNTGIAYWTGDNDPVTYVIKEPPRRKKIKIEPARLKFMYTSFRKIIETLPTVPDICIIEGVEMWTGNVRSLTAAQRGNLFALAYLVGGYINICHMFCMTVKLVYPRGNKAKGQIMWKGQLTPEMVAKRIYRINKTKYPEHIREAVGIGFSVMGVL